jgi:hypothetical protein
MIFKVIVAGGRDFNNYDLLKRELSRLLQNHKTNEVEIVSGTARGADNLGERFANEFNCKIKRFPADWDIYGKSAGYRRNSDMADYADACVCFWDSKSRGTKHMIDLANKKGIPLRTIRY